jgi:acyl dehydratase
MPLSRHALLAPVQALDITVEPRWTMAYAAGVPDHTANLFDTATGAAVHPLFPVAAEWQLITTMRAGGTGLAPDEVRRGIHIEHDLVLHRPLPSAAVMHLTARTVAVGRRRAGATQTIEFTATADQAPLWSTRMTSLYLGVDLDGEPDDVGSAWPAPPTPPTAETEPVTATTEVRSVDAHVYSECARIWNPIHTDVVAARSAGLAEPILHGTATLARSVSIVAQLASIDLADITRIGAAFSAPVPLGSHLTVRLLGHADGTAHFDTCRADGQQAVRSAWCSTRPVTPM